MAKCILVGLGNRGRHWLSQANKHPQCEVVAAAEPNGDTRKLAVEAGLAESLIHETLDAALGASDADLVIDVTPPGVHRAVAEAAFSRGLSLLQEKPISNNWADAAAIVAAAKQHNVKHMVTQNYRFNPMARTMRKVIADGTIGTPGQADIQFYKNWADRPGSHYVTEPFMLINDMMVHHFDLIRYILGADPVAVQAITWNHPWGWHQGDAAHAIVFEFPGPLRATHVAVGCAVGRMTSYNGDWRIEGGNGSITWRDDSIEHHWLHRTGNGPVERAIDVIDTPAPEQAILDELLAAMAEDREPECSGEDNLHSLAMVFGAIESAEAGRRVELSEITSR